MMCRILKSIFFIYFSLYYPVRGNAVSEDIRRNWEGNIVGGTDAAMESYPFAVKFFNKGAMCGGVIYNSFTVITAAHCLEMNRDVSEMVIQAGSRYMVDVRAKLYRVESFVVHENYSKVKTFACDIALLFLREHFDLGRLQKKAVVVNNSDWMNENETKFTVTGWGWTKYDGEVSQVLMKAKLQYVSAEQCSRLHQDYELTSDMFCLYGGGKMDTCRGDSGGGVLWNEQIVGLTSHGDGCANRDSPSVYTNLFVFRNWITERIEEFVTKYCNNRIKKKNSQ